MSSVFDSQFNNTRRASRPAPNTTSRNLFRAIARWFGLAPARRPVATPVQRKGWDHQRDAMLAAGERMLARARRDNQPLSVAVFDLSDLPELESVFGARVANDAMNKVALRLQDMVTSKGLAMRTDTTVLTVLMPGFGRDRAHMAIQKTMGSPCCIELNADDHEIVIIPEFKVQTVRPDSSSLAQIYSGLRRDISETQRRERRRRRYLQLERESHTRPMELRPDSEQKPASPRQPAFAPVAPTMPMPLQR